MCIQIMEIKIYQIDAFTNKVFSGNSAAVCPLNGWLDDAILQKIAMENNLAETAFYVKKENHYEIRWFTPTVEVDLCGHATLATAFVLFHHENHTESNINFFSSRSGHLTVAREHNYLTLNFPLDEIKEVALTSEIANCFTSSPLTVIKGKTDYLVIFENEEAIINMNPNFENIAKLDARGVIVSAKGNKVDFVSRFFAPQIGIIEDPVTGSAHTTLTPYWSKKLNKTTLTATQVSSRGGELKCKVVQDRVEISGQAKLFLKGLLYIE